MMAPYPCKPRGGTSGQDSLLPYRVNQLDPVSAYEPDDIRQRPRVPLGPAREDRGDTATVKNLSRWAGLAKEACGQPHRSTDESRQHVDAAARQAVYDTFA
jgi:hypothetical protein